jgi:hypothetical protein
MIGCDAYFRVVRRFSNQNKIQAEAFAKMQKNAKMQKCKKSKNEYGNFSGKRTIVRRLKAFFEFLS